MVTVSLNWGSTGEGIGLSRTIIKRAPDDKRYRKISKSEYLKLMGKIHRSVSPEHLARIAILMMFPAIEKYALKLNPNVNHDELRQAIGEMTLPKKK